MAPQDNLDLGSQATTDTRSNERRLLEQQLAVDAQRHGQQTYLSAGINAGLSHILSTDDVAANKTLQDLETQVKAKEAAGDTVGLQALDAQINKAIAADVRANDATFNASSCSTFLADVVATVPLFMRGNKGRWLSAGLTAVNSAHPDDSAGDQFMELGTGAIRGLGSQMMFESMGKEEFLGSVKNPGIKNGLMGYTNRAFSTAFNWDTYKDGGLTGVERVGGQLVDIPAIIGDVGIGLIAHGASGAVNAKWDNVLNRNAILGNMFTATVIGTASGAHGEFTHQLGNALFNDGTFDVGAIVHAAGREGFKNMLSGAAGAGMDGGSRPDGVRDSMFVPDPDVSPPAARPARPASPARPTGTATPYGPIRPETEIAVGNDNYRVVSSDKQTTVVEHDNEAHISTGVVIPALTGTMESNGYVSVGTGKVKVDGAERVVPLYRSSATPPSTEVYVDLGALRVPPDPRGQVTVAKVENLIATSTQEVQKMQAQPHWKPPADNLQADSNGIPKQVVGHATEQKNRVVVATDAPPASGTPAPIPVSHADIAANYQGVRIYERDASGTTTPRNYYANAAGDIYAMALQQDGSYLGTLHPEYRALDPSVRSVQRPAPIRNPGTEVRLGSDQVTVVAATHDRVVLNVGAGDLNASINTALGSPPPLTGRLMTADYTPAGTMEAQINDPAGVPVPRKLQLFRSNANPNEVYVNAIDLSGTGVPADSQPVRITNLLSRPGTDVTGLDHINAPQASWVEPVSHLGEVVRDSSGAAPTRAPLGTIAGHSIDGKALVVESPGHAGTTLTVTQAELQSPRFKQVVVYENDPATGTRKPGRIMFADQSANGIVYEMRPKDGGYEAHQTDYQLLDASQKPYVPEHKVGAEMQVGSAEAQLVAWDPTHQNAALQFGDRITTRGTGTDQNQSMTGAGFVDTKMLVPVYLTSDPSPTTVRVYSKVDSAGVERYYADLEDPAGIASKPKSKPVELQNVVVKSEADLEKSHSAQPPQPHLDPALSEIGLAVNGLPIVGHDADGRNVVVSTGKTDAPAQVGSPISKADLDRDYEPVSVRASGKVTDDPVRYYVRKGVVSSATPAPVFEMVPNGDHFTVMSHPEFEMRQTTDASGAVEDAHARQAQRTQDYLNRRDYEGNQARALLREAAVPGAASDKITAFIDYMKDNVAKIDEATMRQKFAGNTEALNLIDQAYTQIVQEGTSSRKAVVENPSSLNAQNEYIEWALSVGRDVAAKVPGLDGDAFKGLRERLEKAQDAMSNLAGATTQNNTTTALPAFNRAVNDLLSNTSNRSPGQTEAQAMAANYDLRDILLKAADKSMDGTPADRDHAKQYIEEAFDTFGSTKGKELLERAVQVGTDPLRVTDFIIFASKQSPKVLAELESTAVEKPPNTAIGETDPIKLDASVRDLVNCARNLNEAYDQLFDIARGVGDVDTFNKNIATNGRYLASSLRELIKNSRELTPIQIEQAIGTQLTPAQIAAGARTQTGALQRAYVQAFPQAAELFGNAAKPEATYEDYRKLLEFVHLHGPDALEVNGDLNKGMLLNWMLVNRPEYNLPRSTEKYTTDSVEAFQVAATHAAQALSSSTTPGVIDLNESNFHQIVQSTELWQKFVLEGTKTPQEYLRLKYDLFDWAAKQNNPEIAKIIAKAFDAQTLQPPTGTLSGPYYGIMGKPGDAGNYTGPNSITGKYQLWSNTVVEDASGNAIPAGVARRAAIERSTRTTLLNNPELEQVMRQRLSKTASSEEHQFLSSALANLDVPSLLQEIQNLPAGTNPIVAKVLFEAIRSRMQPDASTLPIFREYISEAVGNGKRGMVNAHWSFMVQTGTNPPSNRLDPELGQHFLLGTPAEYTPRVGDSVDRALIDLLHDQNNDAQTAADINTPTGTKATPLAVRFQQLAGRHVLPGRVDGPLYYDDDLEKVGVGDILRGNIQFPETATKPMDTVRKPVDLDYKDRVAVLQNLFDAYNPPGGNAPASSDATLNNLVKLGNEDPGTLKRITDQADEYGGKGAPKRQAFLQMVAKLADAGATGEQINLVIDWTLNAEAFRTPPPPPPKQKGGGQPQPQGVSPDNVRRAKLYEDLSDRVIRPLIAPDLNMAPADAIKAREDALNQADIAGTSPWAIANGTKNVVNTAGNHGLATAAYNADLQKAQSIEADRDKLVK